MSHHLRTLMSSTALEVMIIEDHAFGNNIYQYPLAGATQPLINT